MIKSLHRNNIKISHVYRDFKYAKFIVPCVLFFLGFLSSQRFVVPEISALSCLCILLISVGFQKKYKLTFFLLSLLAMVDLGGGAYVETHPFIKYFIYFVLLAFLIAKTELRLTTSSIFLLAYLLIVFFNTLLHPDKIDAYTFIRDLLTLALIIILFISRRTRLGNFLNYPYLMAFSIGLIASELINILFIYKLSSGEYLNYSSFKFVVLLPLLYWLSAGNYKFVALISPFVSIVVSAFGSRMLFLTSLMIIFLFFVRDSRRSLIQIVVMLIALILILYSVQSIFDLNIEAFRVLSSFGAFFELGDIYSIAQFLDPVRYAENFVFFNQDIYSILFGNGLGAGIFDSTGIFAFVPDDGAAFSSKELSESHFFRLHDSWTWFGYRFGFLAYILFVLWGIRGCLNKDSEISFISALMLISLFNATFSIGGIIVCAIFAIYYKYLSSKCCVSKNSESSIAD